MEKYHDDQGLPHISGFPCNNHLYPVRRSPAAAAVLAEGDRLPAFSLRAIAYLIASGDLRTKRHGGRVMITHAELLRQAALDAREPIVPKKARHNATVTVLTPSKAA